MAPPPRTPSATLKWTLYDGWTVARRDLAHLRYEPGQLVGALVFPAIMVVLFGYVFGSAIPVPGGGNYRDYLMPGLFVMTSVTGIMATLNIVAADISRGVMDRFRSMPMARSAVPFGQTGAYAVQAVVSLVIMAVMGLVVGWHPQRGLLLTIAAFAILLLFAYALTWAGVFLGLLVKNEETADQLVPLVFPVTMISNTFVPTVGMPVWLRTIADWNPVSAAVAACRDLFGSAGAAAGSTAWPLVHPVAATLGWSVLLLVVFVPLAVYRYSSAAR
ncbi:MAG TPA: ABC transporter permease [Streptosporangiaceae bacterium]|jgi:ABC-2 type transport system permease protein